MSTISRFKINNLHGYNKNFDLRLKDNTLILVGENGVGKTTVLRLLYYLLSGQWSAISQFKFDDLTIEINDEEHVLPYEFINESVVTVDKKYMRRMPPSIRRKFLRLLEYSDGVSITPELEDICMRFDIPLSHVLRQLELFEVVEFNDNNKLKNTLIKIKESLNAQILYLPTYRRIEQELGLILKGFDDSDFRRRSRHMHPERNSSYVELIEFGMKDVVSAIENTRESLKDFARHDLNTLTLGYLGDVVDEEYSKVDVAKIKNATDETINSVLDRIPESILTRVQKKHLFDRINQVRKEGTLNVHARVICHYFLKLLDFHKELREKESRIRSFCAVCNEYMRDKDFIYDSAEFDFSISEAGRNIDLKHLSSGEKQIVSLFSHLYLSGNKNYFVLIDEPELSLSVSWQRRFLMDIKKGEFCSGLVAVTHSPFIYDNELEPYAHGLGEFVV